MFPVFLFQYYFASHQLGRQDINTTNVGISEFFKNIRNPRKTICRYKLCASYLAKDIILLCSALSTFRLTPPEGNRVALVKYCNFESGLTGELPEAAAALTTLVTGSTSSLDFLTSKQKCRVPLHGSEIDKGKTMPESSLKFNFKKFRCGLFFLFF